MTRVVERATLRDVWNGIRARASAVALASVLLVSACSRAGDAGADSTVPANAPAKASGIVDADTAGRSLAFSTGNAAYTVDEREGPHGSITGDVVLRGVLPPDTTVTPDRDSTGCRAFEDVTFPRVRGARNARGDSAEHSIGNAIVWLVGVTHGPRDSFSRRTNLWLDDCHFEPRVQVVGMGATINAGNRDNIVTRFHFIDHGHPTPPRLTIGFTDPGQLVPSSEVLSKPGLVEVTNSTHPWMHAYIAVAPHPFVAVTEADGAFEFEGVPPGTYQLVVWHERLRAQVIPVRVEAGITTRTAVRY
ncbi:MAG: carboxypeptidase regulatory-like domain-containing protein [Gemmatimonas sp.]